MMRPLCFAAFVLVALRCVTSFQMPSFHHLDRAERDLVFVHVPFDFGHTIESVALIDEASPGRYLEYATYIMEIGGFGDQITQPATWEQANDLKKPGGEVWGHANPDLQVKSNVTGCPMFYTPQKYWPKELAESYFGNNMTVFGTLRDPYERLVAIFRGQDPDYGGDYDEFYKSCDVNGAVKKMMQETLAGDVYRDGCVFAPQAEYFDGPHGITLPVDNRLFPQSMNTVFADHGYSDMRIREQDLFHVANCPEVWSGDLDCETRKIVRQFYARDFQLLCDHFGYCNDDENTCIKGVPDMCPASVLAAPNMSALETHCDMF
mmetsp:Transcript_86261/g.175230  ORF Transcript_86261/g.175230 Transcript_86261/m.175230 type:complete len:320 (-) Transcript_86261:46-1005(-)